MSAINATFIWGIFQGILNNCPVAQTGPGPGGKEGIYVHVPIATCVCAC